MSFEDDKDIPVPLFEHEVRGTSKLFGRAHNIQVVFEGNRAYTDGSTIVYPALDTSTKMKGVDVRIARGFVDHEAAHIRHTDMEFYQKTGECLQEIGNEHLLRILNGVEDVRIESLVNKEYPGAKKNLSATSEIVNKKFLKIAKNKPKIPKEDKEIASIALTWSGRKAMSYEDSGIDKCVDLLNESLKEKLKVWTPKVFSCENTVEAYALACEIYKDLFPEEPPSKCPSKKEIEDFKPSKNKGNRKDVDGDGDGKTKNGNRIIEPGSPEEYGKFLEKELDLSNVISSEIDHKMCGDYVYRIASTRWDRVHHISDTPSAGSGARNKEIWDMGSAIMAKYASLDTYNSYLLQSTGKINVMRRKLEKALASKALRGWDFACEKGRLDSKRLVAAYNGAPNVYKERMEIEDIDTAVTILVDHSGSMKGEKTELATKVSIALNECLSKINISYEILGFGNMVSFPSEKDKQDWEKLLKESKHRYSRTEPLHIVCYKSFDDDNRTAKLALSTMPNTGLGNNTDGDALLFAYERLKVRPEKRKIMFVLSDGQPCAQGEPYGCHVKRLSEVVNLLNKKCDLIGIGICSSAVSHYYPKWVVCDSLDDLPKGVIDMVSRTLLGDRFKCDNSELLLKKG